MLLWEYISSAVGVRVREAGHEFTLEESEQDPTRREPGLRPRGTRQRVGRARPNTSSCWVVVCDGAPDSSLYWIF